jgi:dipeptide/tripeptide permease
VATLATRLRTGFSPVFWIANTLELFERFAFYGSKAVLSFYLANKVGLDVATAASLAGLFSGLIYSLPIVAGVFVDRYGFKRTLAACFAIFTIGYFLIGLAGMPQGAPLIAMFGKTGYVTLVLTLTAVGGSLIKPCIVGTVERTSHKDYRSLGFSIYYALVNLGGAIGPILASEVRGRIGIEYVFVMSALTSALLLGATLLFFREPGGEVPGAGRSFARVFRDMLTVFGNLRFVGFLILFSGFWVMFWQIFYSFPFFVDEYLHFARFEVLEAVDAMTIILFSVPLTALARRLPAIQAMILGILISSASWFILLAWPTVAGAIAALVVFALGESTQAPRFYDYVGSLAPKEQVGTYMGFAFLPIALGSVVAGRFGGWLVENYLRATPANPSGMWIPVAAIGFATTAALILYDRLVAHRVPEGR